MACGGDDDQGINNLINGMKDASMNGDGSPGNKQDGSPGMMTDGNPGNGEGGPGSDSGCGFTNFVIDQITNHTTDDAGPVAQDNIPDPTCSIDNAAAFTSLTMGKP